MIARTSHLPVRARPLTLVRRCDLAAESLDLHGRRWWRVKDPVAMRFWQLGDEEYFLWSQLDGEVTLDELQDRFARRFAPRRIDVPQLHAFLATLHREGLIHSTSPGQGETLLARHATQQRKKRTAWLNLLAIRFPGGDPTWLLETLYPRVAWLLHPAALGTWAFLVLSALLLAALQADTFAARLPHVGEFLAPSNFLLLAVVIGAAKVCHELGHALVCRHLGGRCHEVGVMLLVFTPCLYCNVSDAWLMPSRWRRIAVSGAGIAVELVLAAFATWIWWFSEPGLLADLCANLMIVCSLNTLLFNGNPLLRYDGYFLLSDWLEVPNLRQASDEWLRGRFRRWLWDGKGGEEEELPALHDRPWFVPVYAVAACCYRWTLTVVIWWVVYEWFRTQRMAPLGIAIIFSSAVLLVGQGLHAGWHEWKRSSYRQRLARGRASVSLVVLLGLSSLFFLWPLPRSLDVPATIRPQGVETVYVTLPGVLEEAIATGATVQPGDELARLENDEVERDLVRLSGEQELLRRQLAALRRRQVQQTGGGIASAAGQIPTLEKQLAAVDEQLAQRQADRERLVLRAPRAGTVISLRDRPEKPDDELGMTWSGSPLEARNHGCYLESGTPLCQIGDRRRREAILVADQSQVDAIQPGQRVELRVAEWPTGELLGTVARIDKLKAANAPAELVAKQMLPLDPTDGTPRLVGTFYQVRVELPPGDEIPFGASGYARVRVAPRTLAWRIYEAFWGTFRW